MRRDDVAYDALLITNELVSNAIEHGSENGDEIEIRAQLLRDRLCIVVCDNARKRRVPVALTPDEQRDGGRGLQLVAQLADLSEHIVRGRRELRAELPL
jgi:two-component sensor histidine kinase